MSDHMLWIFCILLILMGRSTSHDFYGLSLIYLSYGILFFTLFQNLHQKFQKYYDGEYYYVFKKLCIQSFITLETFGILWFILGQIASKYIEHVSFECFSFIFLIYPLIIGLREILKTTSEYKKHSFFYFLIFLIPCYFLWNQSFIMICSYGILGIFLFMFLFQLFLFFKEREKLHWNEKAKREELRYQVSYLEKEIFDKTDSFITLFLLKSLLDFVLLWIFYPMFSIEKEAFLYEISGYFLYSLIFSLPFLFYYHKKISKRIQKIENEDQRKKQMEKVIPLTVLLFAFVGTLLSFFSHDLWNIFYGMDSTIFSITSFSLILMYFWYLFHYWNQLYQRKKQNKKIFLLYVGLKLVLSFIGIRISHLFSIPQFHFYFMIEEGIILWILYLYLKDFSRKFHLSYVVLRYKILKTILCSWIVYAILLNIKHLYGPLNNIFLLILSTFSLNLLGSGIYIFLIRKTHLYQSIITK